MQKEEKEEEEDGPRTGRRWVNARVRFPNGNVIRFRDVSSASPSSFRSKTVACICEKGKTPLARIEALLLLFFVCP